MKVGDKVILLEDFWEFKEGDELTCVELWGDGVHEFESKSGVRDCVSSFRYKLKQETMNQTDPTPEQEANDFVNNELELVKNWNSDLKCEFLVSTLRVTKEYHLNNELLMNNEINRLTKRIQDISK